MRTYSAREVVIFHHEVVTLHNEGRLQLGLDEYERICAPAPMPLGFWIGLLSFFVGRGSFMSPVASLALDEVPDVDHIGLALEDKDYYEKILKRGLLTFTMNEDDAYPFLASTPLGDS